MHEPAKKSVDNRTSVAARRRAEMEKHLFSVTLELLAKKPPSEISINDVIGQANVSRGTFYKYFDSLAQVFIALSARLAEDLAPTADRFIAGGPDAATRIATGTRFVLHFARRAPLCGKLIVQSGWPVAHSASTYLGFLQRDVELAMMQGAFEKMHGSVAAHLIVGPMLGGIQTMLDGPSIPDYAEQLTLRILLSLGMNRAAAEQAVALPLPEVTWQPEGLIGEILRISAMGESASTR
jgi:AcrR family transcriptional regulator